MPPAAPAMRRPDGRRPRHVAAPTATPRQAAPAADRQPTGRYLSAFSRSAAIFSAAGQEQPAEPEQHPPQPSPHLSEQSHSPRRVMRRHAHTVHVASSASIAMLPGVMMISRIAVSFRYAAFLSASSLHAALFSSNFGMGLNSWKSMAAATRTATTVHALKETSPVTRPPSW